MNDGVTFTVDGQSHTLKLTTFAMAAIEQRVGEKITQIIADAKTGLSMQFVVAAFVCGLNDGKGVSEQEASDVIEGMGGGFNGAMQIAADALTLALPKQPEQDGSDGEVPPAEGKSKAPRKTK